jgi:hypothetical protein
MKKTDSFKTTFYLGLVLFTAVSLILFLIIYNLFNSLSPKFKKNKPEIYIDDVKPEKEIVHDTVYVDKPIVKVNNIPKNTSVIKTTPVVLIKKDTDNLTQPIITDTTK